MATPLGINNPLQLSNTASPSGASLLHDVGQFAGHTLNALPGYSTLGSQITNPNVNYLGVANPPTPSNNYYTPPAGSSPVKANSTPGTTSTQGQVLGDSTISGSGASTATVDPAYALYAGQANDALARALTAYNNAQAATNQQYSTNQNELTSGLNQTTGDYNTGLTSQDQARLTNDNQIYQNANQGYQSIMRILGGLGAGGGSEAQYLVPQLVGQQLNQQLGGADQTAAQNKQSLTTNYNNYLDQEKNQQKQLNDWKAQQLAQTGATYNDTKAKLSNLLAALNSHADTAANLGSQVNALDATIPTTITAPQTYTGTTPVYTAPNLSTFETQTLPAAQIQSATRGAGSTLPYLALALGQDQQKKQQTV